ncbi:MAG: hypothetical protein ACLUSL_13070 [Ruminococcus sp.]
MVQLRRSGRIFGLVRSAEVGRASRVHRSENAEGRPTKEQKHFLEQMRAAGAIAGVCRSAEEAVGLVKEEKDAVK